MRAMKSRARMACTASSAQIIRTTSRLEAWSSCVTILYGSARRFGLFVIARTDLMTCVSGSSPSGSTMIVRAVCGLAISRSVMSTGLPERQTMRVLRVSGTRSRMASSISTLSAVARMTTATGPLRLALASTSSAMTWKTCAFHPRMSVCPFSSTSERPLRRSSSRLSSPVFRMPMSAPKTNIPNRLTTSMTATKNGGLPVSPLTPGSIVCMRFSHSRAPTPSPSGAVEVTTTRNVPATITTAVTSARPTSIAEVPRDMNASKR